MNVLLDRDAIDWTLVQVNAAADDRVEARIGRDKICFVLDGNRRIDPVENSIFSAAPDEDCVVLVLRRTEVIELLEEAKLSAKHSLTFRLGLNLLIDGRDRGFIAEDLPA